MVHAGNILLKNNFPKEFKGTPLTLNGRFRNIESNYVPGFKDAMKWKSQKNEFQQEKNLDTWRLEVIFGSQFLNEEKDCIVWLGHASFYIQLGKKKILIDPIFGKMPFLSRFAKTPCAATDYKNIDYLLISHSHRDHCDKNSLKIISANNPQLQIFTGLGLDKILKKWFPKNEIQAAGWFQQFNLNHQLKIFYVPSRHWSKRWLNDDNKTLWGGFIIQFNEQTIYFMGDSGFGKHFELIAEKFPAPDICLMGVGAFRPEWFMGPSHISPANAVKAFNQIKGKKFVPMHYGTFDLSDEPLSEPISLLKEMEKNNMINGVLAVLKVGEQLII
jgi:L-ascorbate metabolism protein UlaG (beta-lactamase superfamily)